MNKRIIALIFTVFFFNTLLFGAEQGKYPIHRAASDHYIVYSAVSEYHAMETAEMMEAFLSLFNSYFHFDTEALEAPMTLRIFENKDAFNTYLLSIISEKKENYVFLQYTDPKKNELIGYAQEDAAYELSLVRHGFIQYLKTFVSEPPLWLQRGFTLYLEKSRYDEQHEYAVYNENLSWLNVFKDFIKTTRQSAGGELPSITILLQPDETAANSKESFYAASWGLVSFLMDTSNKDYNRILWDSINTLDPRATRKENEKAIVENVFSWVNQYLFQSDFISYITSMKTFPELVEAGIQEYNNGNLNKAEDYFIEAIVQNGEHYLPYYYLGLINYTKEDFSLAEYYYQSAIILGGDQGLTYYALGVNAFADNRYDEAEQFLTEAKSYDPGKYGGKADKILERIAARGGRS